jgi:hypothetical protein
MFFATLRLTFDSRGGDGRKKKAKKMVQLMGNVGLSLVVYGKVDF